MIDENQLLLRRARGWLAVLMKDDSGENSRIQALKTYVVDRRRYDRVRMDEN